MRQAGQPALGRIALTLAAVWRRRRRLALGVLALLVGVGVWHSHKPMPAGLSMAGPVRPAVALAVFVDRTFVAASGERVSEQTIFDEMFALIDGAESLIVADQFLYNDFQGPTPETTRALCDELTRRLIARKRAQPQMRVVVITDPVNTLYGGRPSPHLDRLAEAGVEVAITNLTRLRDSHLPYSPLWRVFAQVFGNGPGELLPNPITTGRVSLRTYLALLNFKANHRKTLIADRDGTLVGLVSSANPHDGSSAHDNVAIRFGGEAVLDMLASENAVLRLSGATPVDPAPWADRVPGGESDATLQLLTEGAIRDGLVDAIGSAAAGDHVDVEVFYLAQKDIVGALVAAKARGAAVRVLLDPAKDAFGREKNGLPNRSVAYRLDQAGIPVRWCQTRGEQCHAKYVLVRRADGTRTLIAGSANFTRRNLDNLNLETDIRVDATAAHPVIVDLGAAFEAAWTNSGDRGESVDYATYADGSLVRRALSFWMERTGMSTF